MKRRSEFFSDDELREFVGPLSDPDSVQRAVWVALTLPKLERDLSWEQRERAEREVGRWRRFNRE